MKELIEFNLYCNNADCKSEKIHGTEGKVYFIEKIPQKMIFFNYFAKGWLSREYHQQYYCPSCLKVKVMVTSRSGTLVAFYSYYPDELDEEMYEYEEYDEEKDEND